MLGMMVSGGVSGGHLNPAITVAVASVGKFPWWKVSDCLLGLLTSWLCVRCLTTWRRSTWAP